ncbi:phage terminase large subunit [Mechercharimyces sp. CAU 1602]|uniref:phage terminase large subunit n=1 Tax=Mechercharimyces sp. CAU 1602 TaxID=2973933 RepID=UPI00216301CA|nr:phage terminase large subunit [Mechercharimyces sp. CAU 1602]MCS1350312.1 phage terminase large subunit [Mechercharimyces sp. CAU 1602]
MAWIESEKRWLIREERQEVIDTLTELIEAMADNIDDLSPSEYEELDQHMTELERLERIHDCEVNLYRFAWEYFSQVGNGDNPGNWDGFELESYEDAPWFHEEICDIMNHVSNEEINAKTCVAAPRGHAKSSFLSKAFPLHEIVFRKRKYIIIISETPSVATGNMEWLALQLKHNKKLREDFGPLLSPKKQENPRDNNETFVAWTPEEGDRQYLISKVESTSTGQALRGRNWNGTRPDLIICDDLESRENTNTEELRRKLKDWFSQVVIPLGDPGGKRTAYVYMGTTVHHDSLLVHVLKNRKDFKKKIYRAVIDWPERMDLWERCQDIYQDPDAEDTEALENAKAFYFAHQNEMNKGARVVWPEVKPLFDLFRFKWDEGSKAFNTELMNNPLDEESMIFNPEKFTYWDDIDPNMEFPAKQYDIFMGIDFAMGKQRGDYSAIVTIAKDRRTKTVRVIDAWGDKVHPDIFMKIIVDKVMKYQPHRIAAEAQAAQEFFTHKLKEALRKEGYPANTRVKEIKQRTRKELRIEAMLPDIESGRLQFNRGHRLLLWQFEAWPQTADDVPDACEMAWSISKTSKAQIVNKPAWM